MLDVVPPETAEGILRELARIAADDAAVIIGLNFWMDPEKAKARGQELMNGCMLYVNGVLRLVSRTDEEWTKIFEDLRTVLHGGTAGSFCLARRAGRDPAAVLPAEKQITGKTELPLREQFFIGFNCYSGQINGIMPAKR